MVMPKHSPALQRNKIIALIVFCLALAATALVALREQSDLKTRAKLISLPMESQENPEQVFQESLPKPDSPVVAMLKSKDFMKLQTHFKQLDGLRASENLPQVIFYYDSASPSVEEQNQISNALLEAFSDRKKLQPKETVLLAKIFGKSELTAPHQTKVEQFFKKHKLVGSNFWVEATVSWVPLPKTTMKALKGYSKSKLSHEQNDFLYFLAKVKDPKAQLELEKYRANIKGHP